MGLQHLKTANEKNFTTSFGIKLRKYLYKPLQIPLRLATKQKIILEQYPQLEKDKPYIFASTHSFCEDINAALAVLDRNAYLLLGSTDQLEHNPGAYGVWANGMVYVNRLDKESRKNSLKKMERLLNSGTSVLLFPEGAYNNTENLLCEQLFSGFYWLSRSTGAQVVPVASFCEYQSDKIYVKFESPLDLAGKAKDEAKVHLRNLLGIMTWELIRDHSTPLKRRELPPDCRMKFMEERRGEYLKSPWTKDVWEEEITNYRDENSPRPVEVRKSLDHVKITKDNLGIFHSVLVRRADDEKYNFLKFMKETWRGAEHI